MPQRTEQPSGCAERATGGQEVGIDTGEGKSWEAAMSYYIKANLLQRSMLRRQLRKHVCVKSKRNYETETLTTFGNARGASGDVDVVGVAGEVQTMTAGHLDTPDLPHLDVETHPTGAAIVVYLRGGKK